MYFLNLWGEVERGHWDFGDLDARVLILCYRAMVYVEGDATMNTYVDSEGKNRSALNIVERKLPALHRFANC